MQYCWHWFYKHVSLKLVYIDHICVAENYNHIIIFSFPFCTSALCRKLTMADLKIFIFFLFCILSGERLIQFASENLVTEILIQPQINTFIQCIKNLLSSFTRHRHIIHAGYTFAGNGSWVLQVSCLSWKIMYLVEYPAEGFFVCQETYCERIPFPKIQLNVFNLNYNVFPKSIVSLSLALFKIWLDC